MSVRIPRAVGCRPGLAAPDAQFAVRRAASMGSAVFGLGLAARVSSSHGRGGVPRDPEEDFAAPGIGGRRSFPAGLSDEKTDRQDRRRVRAPRDASIVQLRPKGGCAGKGRQHAGRGQRRGSDHRQGALGEAGANHRGETPRRVPRTPCPRRLSHRPPGPSRSSLSTMARRMRSAPYRVRMVDLPAIYRSAEPFGLCDKKVTTW